MQEHAIPVGNLVLPVLLPLAQRILLQEAVGSDNQHGGCSLEAYTALDADDGVAYVAVATDSVCRTNLFHLLNGGNLVLIFHSVHAANLALLESDAQDFGLLLSGMLEICAFGKSLCAVQNLTTTDTGSPDAHIVAVLQLGKVGKVAIGVQIVHLFLATKVAVAGQGDDFHTGSQHQEGHVETDLVIAGTGTAVRNGVRTDFLGIAGYGHGLENTLRTYADGIAVVAKHIAIDHIAQALVIVFLGHVQGYILNRTQLIGILFVLLQLFFAETTGVRTGGIYLITHLAGQVHHIVAGIQSATEGHYHFFLLFHIVVFFYYCL